VVEQGFEGAILAVDAVKHLFGELASAHDATNYPEVVQDVDCSAGSLKSWILVFHVNLLKRDKK
jgi:hypothetical protein